MKQFFTLLIAFLTLTTIQAQVVTEVIKGDSSNANGIYITKNTTLTNTKIWELDKFCYIQPGVTLTIEKGSLIKGKKSFKGTIVVTRGAKIVAEGTRTQPIVFTSSGAKGDRTTGDWGGIIILGRSQVNLSRTDATGNRVVGEGIIEGGVHDGISTGIFGGGAAPNLTDNSGILKFVRIEYSGIPFSANNEINGLTLGGVGSGTTIENVQVSYNGDDAFEFFGGTVNAKNLISFANVDDDFDTDNGFNGNVQFGLAVRNPNSYDAQGASNGFESDNISGGAYAAPFTTCNFSNFTVIGPRKDMATTINSRFGAAINLKVNSRKGIFNSVFMGFNRGLRIDGAGTALAAKGDTVPFLNNIIVKSGTDAFGVSTDAAAAAAFDINAFVGAATKLNDTTKSIADLLLNDPFNLEKPNALPKTGSPLLTGAAFADARLASTYFDKTVTYRGAFGATDWTSGWANFNPDTLSYTAPITTSSLNDLTEQGFEAKIYPNPTKNQAAVAFSIEKTMNLDIQVMDLLGRTIKNIKNQQYTEGVNQVELDMTGMAKGIYLVRFVSVADNAQKTLTLSVL